MTDNVEEALQFEQPSREKSGQAYPLLRKWFDPQFFGLENINPSKPTLFAGNHTRYGFFDALFLAPRIHYVTGLFPRTMADRVHYKTGIPAYRDLMTKNGAILGSRELCSALMTAGDTLMVFPGGGREVAKGKGEDYKLQWQDRLGFVRMAVQHGYSITPFACVGGDDVYKVLIDGREIMKSPIGSILKWTGLDKPLRGGELIMPVSRGLGLTMIPRPERLYFSTGKPIATSRYKKQFDDPQTLQRIQVRVADSVQNQIRELLARRESERSNLPPIRRLLQKC
jgi:1-acyl-sn-glycerol-3-phosphate acyltransferase